jgi:hypothetical protein
MKIHYWLLLLSLGVSACVSAGDVTESHPEPLLENADQWQGVDCQKIKVVPRSEYNRHAQCVAAQLPPLDPNKREHFGEQYSPRKYLECKLRMGDGYSDCDIYKLRRVENPEYWPNPDVPKPKWPDAPKEPVYKSGMSSKQYFEALCKAEAGEFIYKTVENVEGVYQVRPRSREEYGDYFQEDRYVMEDPYGYFGADQSPQDHFVQPYLGRYNFIEVPMLQTNGAWDGEIRKFFREKNASAGKLYQTARDGRFVQVPYLVAEAKEVQPISNYGYVWRGIVRPHDRELSIAGGELAVIDLRTNEILALRRGFARTGYMRNGTGNWWMTAQKCEQTSIEVNGRKREKPDFWFIYDVLKPNPSINDNIEEKK